MAYFDGIQVEDKVWHFEYGWGEVVASEGRDYPIRVKFKNDDEFTFTMSGKIYKGDISQSLFWDEIKITPPPKPKKKEKKTAECWANVYSFSDKYDVNIGGYSFSFWEEEKGADGFAGLSRIAKAKVQIEWEE